MLVIENERSVIKVGKNEHCKAKRWFKFKIELRKKVENLQKITLVLLFRLFEDICPSYYWTRRVWFVVVGAMVNVLASEHKLTSSCTVRLLPQFPRHIVM